MSKKITHKPLKPCPFCGSKDLSVMGSCIVYSAFVFCNKCGASSKEYEKNYLSGGKTLQAVTDQTVAAWNKRTPVRRNNGQSSR